MWAVEAVPVYASWNFKVETNMAKIRSTAGFMFNESKWFSKKGILIQLTNDDESALSLTLRTFLKPKFYRLYHEGYNEIT